MADINKDDLFDNLEDDDQTDQSDSEEAPAPDQDDTDSEEAQSDSDNSEKRIRDLTSKWQKAEAKARKLAQAAKSQTKDEAPEAAPRDDEFTQFMRENVRTTLFSQNPLLAEYGFEASDIAGQTPTEMKASLSKLTKRLTAMEAVAVKRAQERLGIDPDISGGMTGENLPDFASMSDEEFEKYL